jgi:hypothetical protein
MNDTSGGYKFNFRILRVTGSNLHQKLTILVKFSLVFQNITSRRPKNISMLCLAAYAAKH